METYILPVHLLILAYLGWNIIAADHLGFIWMRGSVQTLDSVRVHTYHKRIWYGLVLMIATGLLLFWPMHEFLLTRPQFYIKMSFVAALIINGFFVGSLSKVAETKAYGDLTSKEKLPLLLSGAVSSLSWAGAAIMAFFLIPE